MVSRVILKVICYPNRIHPSCYFRKVIVFIFGLVALLGSSEAKIFSRCDLARELLKQEGFIKNFLGDWVCLVESESSRDTSKISGPNQDGSYNHGIFQINEKYWCETGKKGKGCNAKCEDLRTDDITEASKCAMTIYYQRGFNAWQGWRRKCLHRPKPDLRNCKI